MSRVSEKERLRGFAIAVWETFLPNLSADALEPLRLTKSVAGLREAVRDCVEMLQDLDGDELRRFDQKLLAASLPTLTQMRDRRFRDLQQILGRGEVRNEEEHRLVESFLADVGSQGLSETDRATAESVLRKLWRAKAPRDA